MRCTVLLQGGVADDMILHYNKYPGRKLSIPHVNVAENKQHIYSYVFYGVDPETGFHCYTHCDTTEAKSKP